MPSTLSLSLFKLHLYKKKVKPGSHTDRSHFLVSARTYSISRFIHIQTFCVYKQNVEKCSEVSMAWSIPCGSEGRVTLLSVT